MSAESNPRRWVTAEVAELFELATVFFRNEAVPHRERWLAQGYVDREFWEKAGSLGLLCVGVPEEYGGGGGGIAHDLAVFDAQFVCGETGFGNQIHSGLVAPYLVRWGTEEQKQRWLPPMARGEMIGAIAMTEPGAGSDLKRLRTTARMDGDEYVVNGSKTFISNGTMADLVIVAARTDSDPGAAGISLLAVESSAAGFEVGRRLDKVGLRSQDTAELFFTDMRVPAENLLGEAGAGFRYLMEQLAYERLIVAAAGVTVIERAVDEAVRHAKQRDAFEGVLFDLQNVRFTLADCATDAHLARLFVDDCVARYLAGTLDPATAAMVKSWVSERQCEVVDRCVQVFGGYGYMLEYPVAQMFVDSRIQRIYGGANEVMRELVARSL